MKQLVFETADVLSKKASFLLVLSIGKPIKGFVPLVGVSPTSFKPPIQF